MTRKSILISVSLLLTLSLGLISACGTAAPDVTEEPIVEETEVPVVATEAPTEEATEEPVAEPAGDRVQIRWFVGLGAGSDEPTFEPQQAVVEAFNASQDEIELVLEIIDNDVAYDTLATQIAAGNAPDLVGPVGVRGRDSFKGAWLDLQSLIDSTDYDLSAFDPAMVDFYHIEGEGQLGIPFAIYPSFVIYNADLFDEAGLPYPPTAYGEPYVDADGVEQEWNMDTLRELGMLLTVDGNGNDATSPDFDSESIVQFGFMNQWTDPRGIGTFFGAGSLVDDDGNAQIPDDWRAAWQWTYDGYWNDWFIPNGPYGGAEFLQGAGGPFSTGNLAMVHLHTWYVASWALGDVDFAWNLAPTPSYNGNVTAKMHADTFGIMRTTAHPEEAFAVLSYLLSEDVAPDLLNIYGGMPARLNMQDEWLANYSETNFPGMDINWDVAVESITYADNPNHEAWMPAFLETTDRYNEFWNRLSNEPGLDVDAEIEVLLTDLQAIFEAAED